MNVLVINAGSSSLKYQLFDTTTGAVMAKGLCDRIGIDGFIDHKNLVRGLRYSREVAIANHSDAVKITVEALTNGEHGCICDMSEIQAVGHRIVHGGSSFTESVLVDDNVVAGLEQCVELAPLHTGPHLMGIRGCREVMPGIPQVLVFDTAFHQTMPERAFMYPIPYEMYEKYKIRRYGFHGTSHKYVSREMLKLLDKPIEDTKIITCHLGNGSSISAIAGGCVIDTSMGFTPLDGIIMGSRCGGIDPAIVPFIMEKERFTPAQMNDFMNKKCGILGVSGVSSDCRDVDAAIDEGNRRAAIAMDILQYQIKKFIGAYTAAMNGLDAVVFTAGIGENNVRLRRNILTNMEYLGIILDEEANKKGCMQSDNLRLSTPDSRVAVYLIPTNEELVIATDTKEIVENLGNNN